MQKVVDKLQKRKYNTCIHCKKCCNLNRDKTENYEWNELYSY